MNKFDLYEVITQKIIDRLEAGIIPWQKPWQNSGGMPRNLVSGRPYNGINFWLLLASEFKSPFYMTFEQALSLGGNIRKGEKSTMVVFWKILEKEKTPGTVEKTSFLRYYNIFNLEQTEGIDTSRIPEATVHDHDFIPIVEAERVVSQWLDKPKILWGEDHACYIPLRDTVCMPDQRTFLQNERVYSVLFHELVHSTGHRSRTNRHEKIKDHSFGSEDYSQEELVAEMGAAYLCGLTDITLQTIDNSIAYIQSWIRTFKSDPKVLVLAAAQAQKAVDYILQHTLQREETQSETQSEQFNQEAPQELLSF
ncbi:MAG TPA: zincin-like metallopeptidase domain-containing protein [Prolixibacteraceae bacterium]|nr:zincin-like metallopeptidase domain-containing protein [Prolixibacteraceae bacterium]